MKLTLDWLKYDESVPPLEQVRRIRSVLEHSKSASMFTMSGFEWDKFIHRTCWHWGVHPAWPLVSLQREQSILGKGMTPSSMMLACGVTNQDEAGSANPLWNGLPTQLWMTCRLMSWYLNLAPDDAFGYRKGLWPTCARWRWFNGAILGRKCDGLDYKTADPAEWAQLMYTPHLKVLETNGEALEDFVAPYWRSNP